jgi:predicted RNase H-like nuclease
MMNVIGIDGCRRGWFFVQLLDAKRFSLGVVESLQELRDTVIASDLSLIDIPLGLKSSGKEERGCDLAARRLLGRRASSVFPAPCRQALDCTTYQEGSAVNHSLTGRKLSRLTLLERHLPHARAIVDEAHAHWLRKDLATDDILDALVGAVTASYPKGIVSLPAKRERDELGITMEIVFSRAASPSA